MDLSPAVPIRAVAPQQLLTQRLAAQRLATAPMLMGLAVALIGNWALAATVPSMLSAWTSALLLIIVFILIARISTIAFILLLPFVATRAATMLALIAIDGGAYMPEINQRGASGDAPASFVAITALWLIAAALLIRRLIPVATRNAHSDMVDSAVRRLAWPVLALCMGWGALAAMEGLRTGFPLLAGIDRFLYRRVDSGVFSLALLDDKFVIAALLGAITFTPRRELSPPSWLAAGIFAGIVALSFLFGDKFFTILTAIIFFAMPWLLGRRHVLVATLLRAALPAAALVCLSFAATLYIYSGYGRLPLDRSLTLVGERIAGQGELWFIATRDHPRLVNWNDDLVNRYAGVIDDVAPAASAFEQGVETFYFIERYAPAKLASNVRKNAGWVQFTMGTEAMLLVMFGYAGAALAMLVLAGIVAFGALYVLRALHSGFPISIACSVWIYLQIYQALPQASLWPIAAPGQIKRLLLFLTFELLLLAVNRPARRQAPGSIAGAHR